MLLVTLGLPVMTTTMVSLWASSAACRISSPETCDMYRSTRMMSNLRRRDRLERLLPPADQRDVVAVHLQHAGAALPQGSLVVDHQDPDAGFDFTGDGERIAGAAVRSRKCIPLGLGERTGHPWTPGAGPRGGRFNSDRIS